MDHKLYIVQDGNTFYYRTSKGTAEDILSAHMGYVLAPLAVPDLDTQAAKQAREWFARYIMPSREHIYV